MLGFLSENPPEGAPTMSSKGEAFAPLLELPHARSTCDEDWPPCVRCRRRQPPEAVRPATTARRAARLQGWSWFAMKVRQAANGQGHA